MMTKKRKNKIKSENIIFDIINVLLMLGLIVITLYPLLYVVFASLSEPGELMKNSGFLFSPAGFSWEGYKAVLSDPEILTGYYNTIVNTSLGTVLSLLVTLMLAFALSRKKMYNSKLIMKLIVFTMYFGGGMIPTYLVVRGVGLINTRWAMILPVLLSTYNFIVMRTACMAIPDAMEESAQLDGASDWTVLFKIYMPLLKPTIAVIALFYGSGYWNAWFSAMMYVKDRSLFPLQLILREILIEQQTNEAVLDAGAGQGAALEEVVKYATIVVATVPILTIYPFLQKYFVKGAMIGAVKG